MGAVGEDPAAAAAGLVDPEAVRVIMVEEKRNVIIGVSLQLNVGPHMTVTVLITYCRRVPSFSGSLRFSFSTKL